MGLIHLKIKSQLISLRVWQDPFSLPVFWTSCVAFVYGYAMFAYGYAMLLSKEYSLKQRLTKTETMLLNKEYSLKQRLTKTETINFSFSSVFRLSFEWKQTQNRPCRKQHKVVIQLHRLFKSSVSTLHEKESGENISYSPREVDCVFKTNTRAAHNPVALQQVHCKTYTTFTSKLAPRPFQNTDTTPHSVDQVHSLETRNGVTLSVD